MTLIVLDLETTGLDPNTDDVLEVGAIVLDEHDVPRARFSRLAKRWKAFHDIDPYVRELHTRNGLWQAIELFGVQTIRQVDFQFADWLRQNGVEPGKGILVGNSPHGVDRPFIKVHMPATFALLSHRMRDVGAMHRTLQDWGVIGIEADYIPAHRALLDCEAELAQYLYLKNHLQKLTRPELP